ncbi:WXG100 family type VII secretion target [Peribacillus simplex]|uniref:WXG100 family type VII secretion target n=1 Tax=Peribacillus simplex TaxID=1478 RepID=UPI0024C1016A|nr:WXG100 family type VII secretion target [Peribacillus simplex]WHY54320.1 WXG100 family type VII secretion target [Peribacillus simplex]
MLSFKGLKVSLDRSIKKISKVKFEDINVNHPMVTGAGAFIDAGIKVIAGIDLPDGWGFKALQLGVSIGQVSVKTYKKEASLLDLMDLFINHTKWEAGLINEDILENGAEAYIESGGKHWDDMDPKTQATLISEHDKLQFALSETGDEQLTKHELDTAVKIAESAEQAKFASAEAHFAKLEAELALLETKRVAAKDPIKAAEYANLAKHQSEIAEREAKIAEEQAKISGIEEAKKTAEQAKIFAADAKKAEEQAKHLANISAWEKLADQNAKKRAIKAGGNKKQVDADTANAVGGEKRKGTNESDVFTGEAKGKNAKASITDLLEEEVIANLERFNTDSTDGETIVENLERFNTGLTNEDVVKNLERFNTGSPNEDIAENLERFNTGSPNEDVAENLNRFDTGSDEKISRNSAKNVVSSPEAIRQYIKKITYGSKALEEILTQLQSAHSCVESKWRDAQYEKFGDELDSLIKQIEKIIPSFQQYTQHLHAKASILEDYLK